MTRRADPDALPGLAETGPRRSGPNYRAAVKTVAALAGDRGLDRRLAAARIQAVYSLAHDIDVAEGSHGGKRETYALHLLHRAYGEALDALTDAALSGDDLDWLSDAAAGG
jgi:hypothetical protein